MRSKKIKKIIAEICGNEVLLNNCKRGGKADGDW